MLVFAPAHFEESKMEIVRKITDYAFRGLFYLGSQDGTLVACAQVAKACDIPGPLAHQVLRRLAIAGFLESSAGRYGGFRLAKSPKDISVLAVIEAFQGSLDLRRCVTSKSACSRSDDCGVRLKWQQVQPGIMGLLGKTTLRDLLDGRPKTGHGSRKRKRRRARPDPRRG